MILKENNKMAKYVFLAILCLAFFTASNLKAQFIENKVTLHVDLIAGSFSGESMVKDNGFMMPSLFSNYAGSYGFVIGGTYRFNTYLSAGLSMSNQWAGSWEYAKYSEYSESKNYQLFVSPLLRLHTPAKDLGLLNRVRIFLEVAPGIGISRLTLEDPLLLVIPGDAVSEDLLKESSVFYGVKATTGVKFVINPRTGLLLGYSIQTNGTNDNLLFPDKKFSANYIKLGVFFRFNEDKRFFY